MTNSSNSSRDKSKLIIIHGLNNSESAFGPLREHFHAQGWETHFITLPCHGENRDEAANLEEAIACLDRALGKLVDDEYAVLAYSQGALYFQLWLQRHERGLPRAQVLLAPALYIRRQWPVEVLTRLLPRKMTVKSFSPEVIRRFPQLRVFDYFLLTEGLRAYRQGLEFKVPTMIVIDPKDELVDASKIRKEVKKTKVRFELFPREYLKKGLGVHHVLIHPEYFNESDWKRFVEDIDVFLKTYKAKNASNA